MLGLLSFDWSKELSLLCRCPIRRGRETGMRGERVRWRWGDSLRGLLSVEELSPTIDSIEEMSPTDSFGP